MSSKFLPIVLFTFLLGACANNSPTIHGQAFYLEYARIDRVNRVAKPSAVPAGVVLGGLTGLFLTRNSSSPGKRVVGTAGGAIVGGALADAMNSDTAYEYTLRYRDGRTTRFITEKGFLRTGDCVAVEQGRSANLRRVDGSLCSDNPPPVLVSRVSDSARQCTDAKEQLLAAETEDEVTQASRKVRILCQYES